MKLLWIFLQTPTKKTSIVFSPRIAMWTSAVFSTEMTENFFGIYDNQEIFMNIISKFIRNQKIF